jgi:hypothetical protein
MPNCSKTWTHLTLFGAGLALLNVAARREPDEQKEVGIHPCAFHHGFHLTSDPKSAHNRWTRCAMKLVSRRASQDLVKSPEQPGAGDRA